MSEPALHAARHGGLLVLQLSGELRHTLADALEAWIERELGPGLQRLVIDLSQAHFMDSTVIGMLVLAAQRAAVNARNPPLLLCSAGELWQQLVDLHLDTLFERSDASADPLPLPAPLEVSGEVDPRNQARRVLAAHRALVRHDPRNAATFADLIRLIEAELGADSGIDDAAD